VATITTNAKIWRNIRFRQPKFTEREILEINAGKDMTAKVMIAALTRLSFMASTLVTERVESSFVLWVGIFFLSYFQILLELTGLAGQSMYYLI